MKKSVLASGSSQSSREHKQVGMNHTASCKVNGEWLLHRGRSLNDPAKRRFLKKGQEHSIVELGSYREMQRTGSEGGANTTQKTT